MYEERREKFSFRSFFLTILLVLLFVFLMLWLFPTKWDVKNLQSTYDLERLSVLYDEIFANNVSRMKDAAIGYFTNERMPKKIGESKKLTLKEMYDLHLVLKMKDKDGKACDAKKSYVEMTKYEDEYRLKVNLSCGDIEDYIIVYLGCYDYCDGLCEKRYEKAPVVNVTPEKEQSKVEDPAPSNPTPTPVVKKYMYEYKLVIDDKTTCTDWTKWGKDKLTATNNMKVETKVENELVNYKTVKVQTGTKKETVVVGQKTENVVVGYVTELVVVDTKQVPTGKTTTKTVTEKVKVGTVEVYAGIGSGTKVPSNTSTTVYKNVTVDTSDSCSYCNDKTGYTWEIWKIEPVYDVVTTTKEVPVYKTVNVYEEKEKAVYDVKVVDITEVVEKPVYKEVKVPVYEDVTYYRQKTCTVKKGSTNIEWSYSNIDSNLVGKGYKLTGNVKEV